MGTVADMNALAKKGKILHQLSSEEMGQLRAILTDMLMDIDNVCKKYHLRYVLGYGSCLGAVRHKGFIPWDDDVDLLMPREDLRKFLQVFEQELGQQYEYTAPNTDKEGKNNFTKIYKKGTLFLEISDIDTSFPHGVYIDIFPLDYAPENSFIRWLKGHWCNFLCKTSVSVLYATYSNPQLKEFVKQNKKINFVFRLRQLLGKIASVVSHKTWVNWADNAMQYQKSPLVTVGCGNYLRRVMPIEIILPPSEGTFNGQRFCLPNKPEIYLERVYGPDYMQLPPEEKRERHFVFAFKAEQGDNQ